MDKALYTIEYHTIGERKAIKHHTINLMAYDDVDAWNAAQEYFDKHGSDKPHAIDNIYLAA